MNNDNSNVISKCDRNIYCSNEDWKAFVFFISWFEKVMQIKKFLWRLLIWFGKLRRKKVRNFALQIEKRKCKWRI